MIRTANLAPLALLALHPAQAQPPQPAADLTTTAQAHDRCMTTFAVRLTHTDATDQYIYTQASEGCRRLREQLTALIDARMPAAQAAEIHQALQARAEPDFMALLTRIRTDRARRAAQ